MAVADCVAEGTIPEADCEDLFICVGVFIHWEATDDQKIQDYNYQATKLSIERAVAGTPTARVMVSKKDKSHHPFQAG
jgi:5,6,7,8-tetrahydromethanopterin hydro-lyase